MNSRLKQLRTSLNMTLNKFSKPLGITSAAMSNIENGRRNITNQLCKSICNVNWNGKHVNEEWLLTGKGNMFIEDNKIDKYFEAASILSDDPLIVAIITEYYNLEQNERNKIKQLINTISQSITQSSTEE